MGSIIMDFRVREEMAGAVLKEVAALAPAERLQEADSLTQLLAQAVQGLDDLWGHLREPLQGGISPSDATTLGRILTRSANLIRSSLELLVGESPALDRFREAHMARLERINALAAALCRLVEMPAPAPDLERLRRSLQQLDRGEGVAAEDFLAELNG
jgi:hypothetical protein